eukprot:GSMAST32.ASY1.ANO1.2178.1 assembled CDS
MNKVLGYMSIGESEGATKLCGGDRVKLSGEISGGYFVSPAIFTDSSFLQYIVREEVFGPLLSVLSFPTGGEREVIQRANASIYGLSAGVFTQDIKKAHRVIAKLEAGVCWINNYNLAPAEIPCRHIFHNTWGGYKQSGIGRENGIGAIQYWSQEKTVYVEMGDVDCPYN